VLQRRRSVIALEPHKRAADPCSDSSSLLAEFNHLDSPQGSGIINISEPEAPESEPQSHADIQMDSAEIVIPVQDDSNAVPRSSELPEPEMTSSFVLASQTLPVSGVLSQPGYQASLQQSTLSFFGCIEAPDAALDSTSRTTNSARRRCVRCVSAGCKHASSCNGSGGRNLCMHGHPELPKGKKPRRK
jgi:hypothetical protein